jgi:hypothetical protein
MSSSRWCGWSVLRSVAVLLLCSASAHGVASQQWPDLVQSATTRAAPRQSQLLVHAQEGKVARRASTGLERFGWGLVTGSVAGLGAEHAFGLSARAGAVGYVLGAVLGVGLVTHAREGLNADGLALGALAGTTVGVLCLLGGYALAPADDDYISTSQLAGLIAFLVTVPLGASIGHARIGGVQRH